MKMYSAQAFKFFTRTSGHPKRHFYELLQFDFTRLVGPESLFQFFVTAFQYSAHVLGCVLYPNRNYYIRPKWCSVFAGNVFGVNERRNSNHPLPCFNLESIDFSASTDALLPTSKRLAKSFL